MPSIWPETNNGFYRTPKHFERVFPKTSRKRSNAYISRNIYRLELNLVAFAFIFHALSINYNSF